MGAILTKESSFWTEVRAGIEKQRERIRIVKASRGWASEPVGPAPFRHRDAYEAYAWARQRHRRRAHLALVEEAAVDLNAVKLRGQPPSREYAKATFALEDYDWSLYGISHSQSQQARVDLNSFETSQPTPEQCEADRRLRAKMAEIKRQRPREETMALSDLLYYGLTRPGTERMRRYRARQNAQNEVNVVGPAY